MTKFKLGLAAAAAAVLAFGVAACGQTTTTEPAAAPEVSEPVAMDPAIDPAAAPVDPAAAPTDPAAAPAPTE
jgi:hypothetical protein